MTTTLPGSSAVDHSGTLAAGETRAAGTVKIVEGPVVVPAGVALTIAPGEVVKLELATSIRVQAGGTLDAPATSALPIVLTSIRDDSVAGDTNLDGARTIPEPGDWGGLNRTGLINVPTAVALRFASTVHGGTLPTDTSWSAGELHDLAMTAIVPSGVTLTIAPGAIVTFRGLQGIVVQEGGHLVALGTAAAPITFSSSRDDTVGGDSNGDGNASPPAPGDWSGLNIQTGPGPHRSRDLPRCRRWSRGWGRGVMRS